MIKCKDRYRFKYWGAFFCILAVLFLLISVTAFSQSGGGGSRNQKIKSSGDLPQLLTLSKAIVFEPVVFGRFMPEDTLIGIKDFFSFETDIDKISSLCLSAGYQLNTSSGIFSIYENSEPIIEFDGGVGKSFFFSVGYEKYITNRFSFETGFLYLKYFVSMTSDYFIPIMGNRYAKTEHTAEINLSYSALALSFKYEFMNNLRIVAGFSYAFPLQSEFDHIVKITSDEIIYDGNLTEKRFENKTIDNVNGRMVLSSGISYRVPFISGNFGLEFNGMYNYGINKIMQEGNLKISAFSFGISVICLF